MKVNSFIELAKALEEGPMYFVYDEVNYEVYLDLDGIWCGQIGEKKGGHYIAPMSQCDIELSYTKPIPKHALVVCWDNGDEFYRYLGFYDEKTNDKFSVANLLNSNRVSYSTWDNVEVIPTNPTIGLYEGPFAWANEAIKKLKELD